MSDSEDDSRVRHSGKGLLEFTYRFLTVMVERDLMTVAEAVDFNIGVGNALEFGRNTPDAIRALEQAMEKAEQRRISSPRS